MKQETQNTKKTNIMEQANITEQTQMNNTSSSTPRIGSRGAKKYKKPNIDWIPLDNEISLALESNAPPAGPLETNNATTPTHLTADPYKFANS
jgi:hypothetical protein